jgi:CRISPR/Cas system CSM-associated protein Csm4 (group 5 of RAMP superfamily)
MNTIQTLVVDKKKFALIPYKEYQSLLDTVEDLKDLYEIKKRKNEKRVPISEVRKKLLAKSEK